MRGRADNIAGVAPDIARLIGRKCAQAKGREQFLLQRFDAWHPALRPEHRVWQADRQKLVRSNARVNAVVEHDVVAAISFGIPESGVESIGNFRGQLREFFGGGALSETLGQIRGDAQRVVPERVQLDGPAGARRDQPVGDLGVHPGRADARLTRRQQSIGVALHAEIRPGSISPEDVQHRIKEMLRHERFIIRVFKIRMHRVDEPQRCIRRGVRRRSTVLGEFGWRQAMVHARRMI